jgi:hypothetical protein
MAEHPITPPPELVQQWLCEEYERGLTADHVATQAARWGADQELEACCDWADETGWTGAGSVFRRLRRPKPPSLKEQALKTLKYPKDLWSEAEVNTIRRALEQLND